MDGDLLCVVGPTGCGKTTFLNSLVNIYQITSGEILLDGKQVNTKEQNIAYIFQGDSTMPWLTVEENVRFGLNLKKYLLEKKGTGGEISGYCRIDKIQKLLSQAAFSKYASKG